MTAFVLTQDADPLGTVVCPALPVATGNSRARLLGMTGDRAALGNGGSRSMTIVDPHSRTVDGGTLAGMSGGHLPRRAFVATLAATLTTPGHAAGPNTQIPLAATPISRTDIRWWRERHAAKLAELRERQPALVFYGDSITQQWEYDGPQDWRRYAPIWQRFYGGRRAVNLGFSGDTTASLLWRVQNGQASAIAPRVAVILIGANNLGRLKWGRDDTVAGIERIIRDLRQRLPATRLLLLGILPSDRTVWGRETEDAVNRVLAARFPRGHETTFLDLSHLFLRNGRVDHELYYDPKLNPPSAPLHPTAQAMETLAAAMEPTLATLMKG